MLNYQENLMKEIDFLVIYGRLTLTEAYSVPVVRREIFVNNYTYFKDLEKKSMDKSTKEMNNTQNPNFNKMSFD